MLTNKVMSTGLFFFLIFKEMVAFAFSPGAVRCEDRVQFVREEQEQGNFPRGKKIC